MNCKQCDSLLLRAEAKDGLCKVCIQKNNDPEVLRKRSSFVSGRNLFVEMLDEGGIFSIMKDEQDMAVQNYLLAVVAKALNHDPRKYRSLIERFVNDVIELSGETSE